MLRVCNSGKFQLIHLFNRVPTVREKSGKNVRNSKSGNFEISRGNLKKMAKVREKSGNFRIRRRNFKIVKEKQQVAMAVSCKNKHGCVCHSVTLESLFFKGIFELILNLSLCFKEKNCLSAIFVWKCKPTH